MYAHNVCCQVLALGAGWNAWAARRCNTATSLPGEPTPSLGNEHKGCEPGLSQSALPAPAAHQALAPVALSRPDLPEQPVPSPVPCCVTTRGTLPIIAASSAPVLPANRQGADSSKALLALPMSVPSGAKPGGRSSPQAIGAATSNAAAVGALAVMPMQQMVPRSRPLRPPKQEWCQPAAEPPACGEVIWAGDMWCQVDADTEAESWACMRAWGSGRVGSRWASALGRDAPFGRACLTKPPHYVW